MEPRPPYFFLYALLMYPPEFPTTTEPSITLGPGEKAIHVCTSDWQMLCKDGMGCIDKRWMCDGRVDCADHSDEDRRLCRYNKQSRAGRLDSSEKWSGTRHGCVRGWHYCEDASGCVEPTRTCDGTRDCRDGSDEGPFCLHIKSQLYRSANDNLTYYN